MLIRLISLALLFQVLTIVYANSLEKNFILPKIKPSVFEDKKKLSIKKNTSIYNNRRDNLIFPLEKPDLEQNKPDIEKVEKNLKKIQIVKNSTKDTFVYPKNKPASYIKQIKTSEKSKILKDKDFKHAKEIFSFINERKWNSAQKLTKKVKDKDFKKLVKWLYLLQTGNRATFDDYQTFIDNNPDFPRIGRLKYFAEHKIFLRNQSPLSILDWFERNPPVSGMGKIKLAEAYLELGKKDKVEELIKEGWVKATISKNNLGYYRAKFKSFLSSEDHIRRADYLAWQNKYWDLKRMLKYLPKEQRALYNARQILMSNSYGVDKAISSVPSNLKKDTGLQYDRLKWRNRRGRLEQSLEILYENANKSEEQLVRSDLWWKQRESITRSLIYKKRYKTAYKVSSEHSLSSGSDFAEAEWLSGWIAHAFLKSPEYSINHFLNFYNNVSYPISLARGAYWLGKAYQSLGDSKQSEKYFTEGSAFLTTYYGQLSFNEINKNGEFILVDESFYDKDYEKEFLKNKLVKYVFLLKELDHTKYSKDIIKHLSTLNIDKGSEVLAAKLSTEVERYDYAIQISKQASYKKRFYLKYNYPIITTPREINNKIMPASELILSIIRQESEFDRKANSYVGARGMMQLMKYTAKIVAKQAKLPYSISGLTSNPEYNIKLGSYYFNSLLNNYNNVYPFAIAAYNAGPNRVKTWRRINGDPTKRQLSYVNWIELIRFKETRNYVQRVLENVNVYKYMLSQKPVQIDRFFK
jgi:soluble lytic murein transglycosylase